MSRLLEWSSFEYKSFLSCRCAQKYWIRYSRRMLATAMKSCSKEERLTLQQEIAEINKMDLAEMFQAPVKVKHWILWLPLHIIPADWLLLHIMPADWLAYVEWHSWWHIYIFHNQLKYLETAGRDLGTSSYIKWKQSIDDEQSASLSRNTWL